VAEWGRRCDWTVSLAKMSGLCWLVDFSANSANPWLEHGAGRRYLFIAQARRRLCGARRERQSRQLSYISPSATVMQRRVFKTRTFARWSRRAALPDRTLCAAIEEIAAGLVDADLGGNVLKKRVAQLTIGNWRYCR